MATTRLPDRVKADREAKAEHRPETERMQAIIITKKATFIVASIGRRSE